MTRSLHLQLPGGMKMPREIKPVADRMLRRVEQRIDLDLASRMEDGGNILSDLMSRAVYAAILFGDRLGRPLTSEEADAVVDSVIETKQLGIEDEDGLIQHVGDGLLAASPRFRADYERIVDQRPGKLPGLH